MLKHDEYVEQLREQLEGNYTTLYRGLPLISKKGRMVGEIDLLAVNDACIDIFEVKCSFRPTKARKQLEKIRKIVGAEYNQEVNTWFYCGEAGKLVKI